MKQKSPQNEPDYAEVCKLVRSVLAKNLKEYRLKENLTQTTFANMVCTCRTHYCRIENGLKNVSINMLAKYARGLNIPLTALFKGLEGAPPNVLYQQHLEKIEQEKKERERLEKENLEDNCTTDAASPSESRINHNKICQIDKCDKTANNNEKTQAENEGPEIGAGSRKPKGAEKLKGSLRVDTVKPDGSPRKRNFPQYMTNYWTQDD